MAANFPNSPNTNDTFTSNGVTFFWNGEAWKQPASPGVKGTKGDTGTKGEKGQKGDKGDKGQKGEIGLSGNPGGEGDKGDKGQKGEGQKGQKGQDGNDGTGIKGNKGESGTSVKGQKGDDNSTKGEKGQKGVDGDDGTSVKGQKGQKGDDNSTKGQKGDVGTTTKGQKGEPGADNSTKGQKGEQGSSGSATISNNADNRVITGGTGTNLNAEQNLTFDGSTLNVIGSGTPTLASASDLDITATTATFSGTASFAGGHPTSNFYSGADDLVVANFTQDTGISIMSGTSNEANIAFGSTTFGTGAIQARLYYDSGDDKLIMNTITTGHDIEIKSGGTITLGDLNNPTITIEDMSAGGSNYGVEVDGTIYPKASGAHTYRDLGLSGIRWTNVYATNLHGDGSNITNVSNTAARKVRIAENTGTISGNYGSYTNVLNISSFVPNSTNSVFLITVTIGNFYRSSGSGSAWGRMLINDNGTQVDGVEHYFQTDTDSGSKNISIIDTRGGTSARNYGIQLMRGNNNGVPSIQNIRIMCIEMDTSI